ncbi:MAG: hypothetical protein M1827_005587 [Pycnora praestabilis]|nr:MAG: hypothetical protein M1827_005587 [Pycnora praestabilis]
MDITTDIFYAAQVLSARATANSTTSSDPDTASRPSSYKGIGISLAIASGLFIGVSFVLKKIGLLKANVKYNQEAGEGYGYLKNAWWWSGMTLMIIGEVCNFGAYIFVDAILVTPLGALSVVITTILSAIFLKERLSFVGKVGCFNCIIGSVVIVLNAPEQAAAANIQQMQKFVIAPGFLSYMGVVLAACAFTALWLGPRYGKKSMLVYISVCSLIGGLSVSTIQGLGAAITAQARGTPQFNHWFTYVLLVFIVCTLVTEIIFLNKALNLFNAALVTPTYYVFFTSSTIITSAVLYRGFKGSPLSITTMVMGFLQICAGVVLLQLSKSAKDVPDAQVFTGDLDQVRTVAEQEQPESEPKADAIRGAAAIVRQFSMSRQKMEATEAKRVRDDRLKDLEPIGENEHVEWDGLRRRKTVLEPGQGGLQRRKTLHPPLGLTRFPDETEQDAENRASLEGDEEGGFLGGVRKRARSVWVHGPKKDAGSDTSEHTAPLTDVTVPPYQGVDTSYKGSMDHTPIHSQFSRQTDGAMEMSHVYGLPPDLRHNQELEPGSSSSHAPPLKWADDVGEVREIRSRGSLAPNPPPHTAKRQFSFQNVFHRHRTDDSVDSTHSSHSIPRPLSRLGVGSRRTSKEIGSSGSGSGGTAAGTEEERLGLVKGDSRALPPPEYLSDDEDNGLQIPSGRPHTASPPPLIAEDPEREEYEASRQRWSSSRGPTLTATSTRSTGSSEEMDLGDLKDWEGRGGGRTGPGYGSGPRGGSGGASAGTGRGGAFL